MQRSTIYQAAFAMGFLFSASSAFASFGGCVISPENPTVVLGLLGSAAASAPWLKARWQARRRSR